jgi:hypothetical protein
MAVSQEQENSESITQLVKNYVTKFNSLLLPLVIGAITRKSQMVLITLTSAIGTVDQLPQLIVSLIRVELFV